MEAQTQAYFENLSVAELLAIVDDGLPEGFTYDFSDVTLAELELVAYRWSTNAEAVAIWNNVKVVPKQAICYGELCDEK